MASQPVRLNQGDDYKPNKNRSISNQLINTVSRSYFLFYFLFFNDADQDEMRKRGREGSVQSGVKMNNRRRKSGVCGGGGGGENSTHHKQQSDSLLWHTYVTFV